MKLDELVRNTDAHTYLNAIKVAVTEIKETVSEIEDQATYITNAVERAKKLTRKVDGQYRLLFKLVHKDGALASEISIDDAIEKMIPDIKELMEQSD